MATNRRNSHKAIVAHRAAGYSWQVEALCNADSTNMTWAYAEGGVISSILDLAQWDRSLTTRSLLPQARLRQMWDPLPLTNGGAVWVRLGSGRLPWAHVRFARRR